MSKPKKLNKAWLARHLNDPYVKLAQRHGYRSRAAYKLSEIDDQDHLIRPGQVVVDLGAAPGAWCQVLRERMRGRDGVFRGRLIALDLLPMEPLPDVTVIAGDFRELATLERLEGTLAGAQVDLVVSDLAPNLSGVAVADAARMADLSELAIEFAVRHLRPDGALLMKAFHGSGYSQLVAELKRRFARVLVRKPRASREESAETYLLARDPRAVAG